MHQKHARTDQDKALTYSHGRFEYQQRSWRGQEESGTLLGGVRSLLVIDFDEFAYCPSVKSTLADQFNAIKRTAAHNRVGLVKGDDEPADEIIWGRVAVNNVSTIDECLQRTHDQVRIIILCFFS